MPSVLLAVLFSPLAAPARAQRPPVKGLSRPVAEARAERVSQVRYALSIELSAEASDYEGVVAAEFSLTGADEALTVDFEGGRVDSVTVNGRSVDTAYNGHFLMLPSNALREGANTMTIAYRHPYSNTGAGLYRFKDPADGLHYLYTDFEPYDANRLFPCFDQPDIKARYRATVTAPEEWVVVSSTLETEVLPAGKGRSRWEFPETPPFSTYLFSLHAGNYRVWKARAGLIPLRLMARKSFARHIDAQEWFDVTRKGLSFFNDYFGYDYPFHKYDQLIVPDFNSGAMENTAAVTFSERYIQRGASTWNERRDRADVILHEMAHMWFGNLVTMKWWDDLWLNESFASYMSAVAVHDATRFKDAWEDFLLGTKQWAYWEDQLVTTHPIEAEVRDTASAFANFDGITYGKGASSLKQAAHLIGEDGFKKGARLYFDRHAFQNTVRKDFIDALADGSGKNLDAWTEQWLRTAGVNTLSAEVSCVDGKVENLTLVQGFQTGYPTLRRHAARVALFDKRARPLAEAAVEYEGPRTATAAFNGRPCPALVYPNAGDHDYAKTRLDPKSLKTAKSSLKKFKDPLSRAGLWMTLWDMVIDAEMPVEEYLDIVLDNLEVEIAETGSLQTLKKVLETLHGRSLNSTSVLQYLAGETDAAKARRLAAVERLEKFLWKRIGKIPGENGRKMVLYDAFAKIAQSADGLNRLAAVLDGEETLRGWTIDQDRRWSALKQLHRFGYPEAAARVAAEAKRDGSSRGQKNAISAAVVADDWNAKKAWLDESIDPDTKKSLADLKAAMNWVFPYEQAAHRRRFASTYFSQLPILEKTRPHEFLGAFAEKLVPATCSPADEKPLADFIDAHPNFDAVAIKDIKVAKQENARCVKVRALIESGS
ncbi:MAG: aminopeptidase N [Elusimicrobia bacterium CG1_02_63_36]|nr:MAG: aminopeptidase N [Elusimicrobia bacterium CG1_02_63_36]PJA12939.1 MAG: aminopeptidase N [Elusimicrobia bacterium CG_4_10_14_0_2_um_filter_63_34]